MKPGKSNFLWCDNGTQLHVWYSSVAYHIKAKNDHCVRCGYRRRLRTYVRRADLDRFMDKTEQRGDCLLWTGAKNDKGYPLFNARNERGDMRATLAHRWIFKVKFDYLPSVVMHSCDIPLCVNWDHLVAGEHADNMHDMIAKGRDRHERAAWRLAPAQVKDIRIRRESGETCKQLASAYGVSVNCISNCVNGHTYRDIA